MGWCRGFGVWVGGGYPPRPRMEIRSMSPVWPPSPVKPRIPKPDWVEAPRFFFANPISLTLSHTLCILLTLYLSRSLSHSLYFALSRSISLRVPISLTRPPVPTPLPTLFTNIIVYHLMDNDILPSLKIFFTILSFKIIILYYLTNYNSTIGLTEEKGKKKNIIYFVPLSIFSEQLSKTHTKQNYH